MSRSVILEKPPAIFSLVDAVSTKLFVLVAVTALVTACVADAAQNCTALGDCSGEHAGEQCCNGKCTTTDSCLQGSECSSNDDCFTSQVCCSSRCVTNWDCLEHFCSLDADCRWNETCHNGFCKRNNECANVLMVVILSIMFISLLALCSCVCEKITAYKRGFSSLDLLLEITFNRRAILTGRNLDSNRNLNTNVSSSFPPEVTAHFSVPRGGEPLLFSSEKLGKETVGANKPMTWYGATCETV